MQLNATYNTYNTRISYTKKLKKKKRNKQDQTKKSIGVHILPDKDISL